MHPGGVTEQIWHFAGYLHLTEDIAQARLLYELTGYSQRFDNFVAGRAAEGASAGDQQELDSERVDFVRTLDASSPLLQGSFKALQFAPSVPSAVKATPAHEGEFFKTLPVFGPFAGGGNEVWPDITIEYGCWAPQRLIYAEQLKSMSDNDTLLSPDGTDPGDLHGIDFREAIDSMLEQAAGEAPDDLHIPLQNQNATAEFFAERDAARKSEGPPEEPSVEDGIWIDGELQAAGSTHPELPPFSKHEFELPTSDGTVAGLAATLGSNTQTNLAQIVDLNEAAQTTIVLGDHFNTNAILQFNVYQDKDSVAYAGAADVALGDADANQATNIAEFLNKTVFEGGSKPFGGPKWHVDVLDGDFLDVKTLVQQNWMVDNDVTVQTTEGAYYRVLAGGNTQISLGSYFDLKHYDVIIVCGDYHEANVILQKNILIDNDILKVAADLGPGHGGFSQQLSWNGNTLINDATITDIGVQDSTSLTPDLADLVELLGEGTTTDLDSSYGWLLTGNGTGRLDVLYVTGSYYDVNIVTQMNVLCDLDTAIQYLPGVVPPRDDQREDGEALEQSASTGGNKLTNSAVIVDAGALVDEYLKGDYYDDTILIQANIIIGEDEADDVLVLDTTALVPELVAFTGDPEEAQEQQVQPVKDILQQSDVMGNVLA